jgi:translation initiation factor 3 subunit H
LVTEKSKKLLICKLTFDQRQENAQRKLNGEEPLPEEDPNIKPIPEPSRLESLLFTDQISSYCKDINHFSANSFAKLFLSTHLNNA